MVRPLANLTFLNYHYEMSFVNELLNDMTFQIKTTRGFGATIDILSFITITYRDTVYALNTMTFIRNLRQFFSLPHPK